MNSTPPWPARRQSEINCFLLTNFNPAFNAQEKQANQSNKQIPPKPKHNQAEKKPKPSPNQPTQTKNPSQQMKNLHKHQNQPKSISSDLHLQLLLWHFTEHLQNFVSRLTSSLMKNNLKIKMRINTCREMTWLPKGNKVLLSIYCETKMAATWSVFNIASAAPDSSLECFTDLNSLVKWEGKHIKSNFFKLGEET